MKLLFLLFLAAAIHAAPVVGIDGHTVSVGNPARIVALNASTVDILAALGEDRRIVGSDASGVPLLPGRKDLANFGHPNHLNLEAVLAASPDLVIATADFLKEGAAGQLRSAKVPVLLLEASSQDGPEGLKRRISAVASLFDQQEAGRDLNAAIDRRLAALREKAATVENRRRVFFLYTHGPGHALIYGRDTGAHWLIELAGATNAADFTEGYKPLTPEALVAAAPDDIIMLDRSLKAVGGLDGALALTGVALTPAGKNKAIHTVDDSIRWIGPRFLDDVEKLHRALYPAAWE